MTRDDVSPTVRACLKWREELRRVGDPALDMSWVRSSLFLGLIHEDGYVRDWSGHRARVPTARTTSTGPCSAVCR